MSRINCIKIEIVYSTKKVCESFRLFDLEQAHELERDLQVGARVRAAEISFANLGNARQPVVERTAVYIEQVRRCNTVAACVEIDFERAKEVGLLLGEQLSNARHVRIGCQRIRPGTIERVK